MIFFCGVVCWCTNKLKRAKPEKTVEEIPVERESEKKKRKTNK